MTIRAIVFDMDGVLIDAREWHYEALNAALGHFGLAISRFDHLVTYDGLPTRTKLEMLSLEQGLPVGLHSFVNGLKQQFTMETVSRECRPTFAHEYALRRLRSEGLRLAVASNSVRPTIEAMLGRAGILPLLEAITSADDVARGKPDPEIYLRTLESMRLSADEVLVVEDNDKGVAAAQAAGCRVLEVSDPSGVTYDRISSALAEARGALL